MIEFMNILDSLIGFYEVIFYDVDILVINLYNCNVLAIEFKHVEFINVLNNRNAVYFILIF